MDQPLAGTAVLVADDNADNADMLALLLAQFGASVRTAASGRQVLDMVSSWTPDVFLLDIGMPDMDGCELVRALRLEPSLQGVPALAVTGYASPADQHRSVEAGFDAHVPKPIDHETLVSLIITLTAKSRPLRAAGAPATH